MVTIAFNTLGCRLNQSETAVVQRTFDTPQYRIVDFNSPADIAVINTCTVTENGDADTRRLVNKAVRFNPNVRIALMGCQAQIQKEKLTELPNVRWVVGNARKMNIKEIIEEFSNDTLPAAVITPAIEKKSFTVPLAPIDEAKTRANIKIQDGCDFFCSFCEIPYARGRARSREFDDIIEECRVLAAAGHKEIVITGINVGTYFYNGRTISDILDELETIEKLKRIRISSIEPTTIDWTIINRMADPASKLCRYLHIPLQSGHNDILARMKRKYTLEEFDAFITKAKEKVAGLCIGTDVIVGFPGESDDHFNHTAAYLRDAPIDYFHVFTYSERHLAKSQHFDAPVDINIKKERSRILRELSFRKRSAFYKSLLNTRQQVLFEQQKEGAFNGLTDNYARVFIKTDKEISNKLLSVEINNFSGTKLYGRHAK